MTSTEEEETLPDMIHLVQEDVMETGSDLVSNIGSSAGISKMHYFQLSKHFQLIFLVEEVQI